MDTAERLFDGHILIGGRELLDFTDSEMTENDDAKDKAKSRLTEVMKEMRVRFGTLLKMDNVSFLLGAGASIDAGGISLATIPIPIEKAIVKEALESNTSSTTVPAWVECFYQTASLLSGRTIRLEDRKTKLLGDSDQHPEPIPFNFEEYLGRLYTWLAGFVSDAISLKITTPSDVPMEMGDLRTLTRHLTHSLTAVLNLPHKGKEDSIRTHRRFLKKLLTRPLNLRRVNLFTLNYDTMLEQAADAEGTVLVDGFIGSLRRVFRPESFDIDFYFPAHTTEGRVHRFDRAIHLYKLHGSLTWHRCDQNWENPFGLYATYHDQDASSSDDVVIFPSPLKYGQTLAMPYSELFRRFGNAIAQPQSALFVIGYGFGDDHVNALIRQALAIPSFTLVVVDPNPTSGFVRDLQNLRDERVWMLTGMDIGTFAKFVENLLPDLREEEISRRVMRTFQALSTKSNTSIDSGEDENDQ
ncbi:SIR2 family protein [bacterium]|nr:SIR2 family protein [bacterium]